MMLDSKKVFSHKKPLHEGNREVISPDVEQRVQAQGQSRFKTDFKGSGVKDEMRQDNQTSGVKNQRYITSFQGERKQFAGYDARSRERDDFTMNHWPGQRGRDTHQPNRTQQIPGAGAGSKERITNARDMSLNQKPIQIRRRVDFSPDDYALPVTEQQAIRKNQFKVDRQVVNAPIPKPTNKPLRGKKPSTLVAQPTYGSSQRQRETIGAGHTS